MFYKNYYAKNTIHIIISILLIPCVSHMKFPLAAKVNSFHVNYSVSTPSRNTTNSRKFRPAKVSDLKVIFVYQGYRRERPIFIGTRGCYVRFTFQDILNMLYLF